MRAIDNMSTHCDITAYKEPITPIEIVIKKEDLIPEVTHELISK